MTDPSTEAPDPQAQLAIARVRRLMLLTMGATVVALAIILALIGYRVFRAGERAPRSPTDLTAVLPAGAKVISAAIGDGRLAVTIEINGATEIRLFDAHTLQPAGRVRLGP